MTMEKKYIAIISIIVSITGLASAIYLYQIMNPPLTFYPMKTEELTFTSYAWGTNNAYFNMTVKNTSPTNSSQETAIALVRINNGEWITPDTPVLPYALPRGQQVTIKVTSTFSSGMQYNFTVLTAQGNKFGPYTKTAP
jgi:hypothetical protein